MIRVKICCISSAQEAAEAIAAGASLLGLVSRMPSGPGVISEALIAEIARRVPPGVTATLLTCANTPEEIIAEQRRTGAQALQFVDALPDPERTLGAVRRALPGIALIPVVHVRDDAAIAEARALAPFANAILLDSGNPGAEVKELGGTGRTHDWEISARLVETLRGSGTPVFLAGGLRPENVGDAIRRVRPFGLDLCSGVRTGGALDPAKLRRFMDAVAAA